MAKLSNITIINLKRQIIKYTKQGLTIRQIANKVGRDKDTIHRLSKELGKEFMQSFMPEVEVRNAFEQLSWLLTEYYTLYKERPSIRLLDSVNKLVESRLRMLQSLGMLTHELGSMNIRELSIQWIRDDSREAEKKLKKIGILVD